VNQVRVTTSLGNCCAEPMFVGESGREARMVSFPWPGKNNARHADMSPPRGSISFCSAGVPLHTLIKTMPAATTAAAAARPIPNRSPRKTVPMMAPTTMLVSRNAATAAVAPLVWATSTNP
jgi:hypothetical protein